MLENDRLTWKIRLGVNLSFAARRARGLDHETIRREIMADVLEAMRDNLSDELEIETGVSLAHRELDRLLTPGEVPTVQPRPAGTGATR